LKCQFGGNDARSFLFGEAHEIAQQKFRFLKFVSKLAAKLLNNHSDGGSGFSLGTS
jgi:hypothetical protein